METGSDHKAQFLGIPVPGITPESCRRQRSSEDQWRRQRCWHLEVDAVFQEGPLIDQRETEQPFLSDALDEC